MVTWTPTRAFEADGRANVEYCAETPECGRSRTQRVSTAVGGRAIACCGRAFHRRLGSRSAARQDIDQDGRPAQRRAGESRVDRVLPALRDRGRHIVPAIGPDADPRRPQSGGGRWTRAHDGRARDASRAARARRWCGAGAARKGRSGRRLRRRAMVRTMARRGTTRAHGQQAASARTGRRVSREVRSAPRRAARAGRRLRGRHRR